MFRIISHYDAALYTARRSEMCDIVEVTFRYLADRPQVHSDVSGLPFMVIFCLHANFMLFSCCFRVLVMLVKLVKLVMCSLIECALDLCSELYQDMLHHDFFTCLRESNDEFVQRSRWYYTHRSPVNLPPDVIVLPPV